MSCGITGLSTEVIAEYGERMQPNSMSRQPFMRKLQQQRMSLKLLVKSKRSFLNKLHALAQLKEADKAAVKACKVVLASIEKQAQALERQMQQTAEVHCRDLFPLLQTIPGISTKSAIELIVVFSGFKHFTSARQFSAFIGISPCINESGTLIRGYRGSAGLGTRTLGPRSTFALWRQGAITKLAGSSTSGWWRQEKQRKWHWWR